MNRQNSMRYMPTKELSALLPQPTDVQAHSSTGEGDNANLKLIPFLAEMRDIYQELTTNTQYFNDEFTPAFYGLEYHYQ